jgi:hypothetical protein
MILLLRRGQVGVKIRLAALMFMPTWIMKVNNLWYKPLRVTKKIFFIRKESAVARQKCSNEEHMISGQMDSDWLDHFGSMYSNHLYKCECYILTIIQF